MSTRTSLKWFKKATLRSNDNVISLRTGIRTNSTYLDTFKHNVHIEASKYELRDVMLNMIVATAILGS